MTSTIKRHIAREWLTFLACIMIGFSVTYFALYFNQRVFMGYSKPEFDPDAYLASRPKPAGEPMWKYKNPGDLFNDLWPIINTSYYPRQHHEWDEQAVKLWLCILIPYLSF